MRDYGACTCISLHLHAGSESGIVLLSTVRSKPRVEIGHREHDSGEKKTADIGWIRRNLGFVTDRHQICVGLTRCKYGLVIVGKYIVTFVYGFLIRMAIAISHTQLFFFFLNLSQEINISFHMIKLGENS